MVVVTEQASQVCYRTGHLYRAQLLSFQNYREVSDVVSDHCAVTVLQHSFVLCAFSLSCQFFWEQNYRYHKGLHPEPFPVCLLRARLCTVHDQTLEINT